MIKSIHIRSLFPQFYSNHHPNTYPFSTKKGLRRQVRRQMNGSETEEILKEKSSNKRTENISSSTKNLRERVSCYREISGYVWPLKQILSESEHVIRFRSPTTFESYILFRYSYERCFHSIIFASNQFWIFWRHLEIEKDIPFNNLQKISSSVRKETTRVQHQC